MAQQAGSSSSPNLTENLTENQNGKVGSAAGGTVDAVSVLYVIGGIPAILAFLVLLFAVGVRVCGLPA